jgi:hypothetical protein
MILKGKKIVGLVIVVIIIFSLIFYFKNNEGASKNEFIKIDNIKVGQTISFPLLVRGTVTGGRWAGFEGQVGRVELVESGNILGVAPLKATSDFMKFPVSFEATLNFNSVEGKNVTLVFHNENPSGLSEYEEIMVLPINILNKK